MKKIITVSVLFILASTACWSRSTTEKSGTALPESRTPAASPAAHQSDGDDVKNLARHNNKFALDIYRQLSLTEKGNIFFSPGSISTAMAMTFAGARNQTEKEMAKVMHFELPGERLHAAFSEQRREIEKIQAKKEVRIAEANALWPEKSYTFLPAFVALNKKFYGVEITALDYINAAEKARLVINEWVETKTEKKIQNLIPEKVLDELTRLVLTNAIYFKGFWEHQFEAESTKPQPFHLAGGKEVQAPLMFQKEKFGYKQVEDAQVVELPYRGGDLSMIVILPRAVDGLKTLENGLDAEKLEALTSNLEKTELNLYLPKFKTTSMFKLSETLKEMGMPVAFTTAADFSGMDGTTKLFITEVLHKAFVAVDEEGTEAAAATAVVIGMKSMPAMPEIFRADHPFLFLIRENRTGGILFLGRVFDPTAEG